MQLYQSTPVARHQDSGRRSLETPESLRSRVKAEAIDAKHLSTLLCLDASTAVTVPDELTEAARNLVRAREDCRPDLTRVRHRLSKLLLRHGIANFAGAGPAQGS